jgi:hypothetical protein
MIREPWLCRMIREPWLCRMDRGHEPGAAGPAAS